MRRRGREKGRDIVMKNEKCKLAVARRILSWSKSSFALLLLYDVVLLCGRCEERTEKIERRKSKGGKGEGSDSWLTVTKGCTDP
jgi:hypothetical protein